jgi:uncharacterized protein HemY
MGAVFYRAGDLGRAVQFLEEASALERRGGTVDDWLFLAMAYQGQGRREEAARALAKGLAMARKKLETTRRELPTSPQASGR